MKLSELLPPIDPVQALRDALLQERNEGVVAERRRVLAVLERLMVVEITGYETIREAIESGRAEP